MKYSVTQHEKYVVLELDEEKINSLNAPTLKSKIVYIHAEGQDNILIDMSKVKYVDSSGLSALLVGTRTCKATGGIFVLINIQPHVEKLIKISRLESTLIILGTIQEAREAAFLNEMERELEDDNELTETE